MFTGIIKEIGLVHAIQKSHAGIRIFISAKRILKDLKLGGSMAVNGVCLTAVEVSNARFCADLLPETLRDTNMGSLAKGDNVNLEPAMLFMKERIDGHLVSGHVEGVGTIQERKESGNTFSLKIKIPANIKKYAIVKGSIAVDGVSLTIQSLNRGSVTVAIIPATAKMTTLGIKAVGAVVNLESDLIAKYVARTE